MGVPSRWSAGTQWGSAASDPLEAYWGPNAVPVQRPVCYVSIAGVLQPTVVAATWRLGRNGWFDDLVPSTASFTFYDAATGSIGDTVLVTSEAGLHWSGTVESISTSKQLGTGLYASSVTAVDNRVAELRAGLGLSQAALAERLGVSRQTVISIERGRFDPSLPLAFRIARTFERSIEDVFTPE